jgi:hypothetical protein
VLTKLDRAKGQAQANLLLPSRGFGLHHLGDPFLATGWVRRDDDRLLLQDNVSVESIREVVSEMFEYFTASDVPSPELLNIQSAVDSFDIVPAWNVRISLFAYAWLNIMVRDDLAEQARQSANLWSRNQISIDTQRICQRRLQELVHRGKQELRLRPGVARHRVLDDRQGMTSLGNSGRQSVQAVDVVGLGERPLLFKRSTFVCGERIIRAEKTKVNRLQSRSRTVPPGPFPKHQQLHHLPDPCCPPWNMGQRKSQNTNTTQITNSSALHAPS